MSNELKNEFKDFIRVLSTEICKEVLLEEMQKISNSFYNTSNKYEDLYENYKKNIDHIKQELNILGNTSKEINRCTSAIDLNTNKVNEALDHINKGQEKALKNIIENNQKSLLKYSTDIENLNKSQRDIFIKELNTSLSNHSEKYAKELKLVFNGSDIQKFFKNTEDIIKKLDLAKSDISSIGNHIYKIENNIKSKNEEESKLIITKLDEKTKYLEQEIKSLKNKLNNNMVGVNGKIDELVKEIQIKNNIMMKINIGTGVIVILLLLLSI